MGEIGRWKRTRYGTGESDIERDLGVCECLFWAQRRPKDYLTDDSRRTVDGQL